MSSSIISAIERDIARLAREDANLQPRTGYSRAIARLLFEEHENVIETDKYGDVGGFDLERALGEARSDNPQWFVN